jgi:hypothetical protein
MTDQAPLLYQLQTLDIALSKRRVRLKEIAALLGDDHKVAEARAALTDAEGVLRPLQTRGRDLDLEIKALVDKIKAADDRLYSGKIRNPKEMQELQDEIASLKKRQSHLEDDSLEVMMRVEDAQAGVEQSQAALKTALALQAGDQLSLRNEQEKLTAEVRQAETERKAAAQQIDPSALKQYEQLRVAKKGGAVVAPLVGESCKLCGVEQTTSIVQKVHQSQELTLCWSCGRILVML